jgi:hypothetical protein
MDREPFLLWVFLEKRKVWDTEMQVFNVTALLTDDPPRESKRALKPLGCLVGEYVIPYEDRVYVSLKEARYYFEDYGDFQLSRICEFLEKDYFPRIGVNGMREWANCPSPAIARLEPYVPEALRGKGYVAKMLELFCRCFRDEGAVPDDYGWKNGTDMREPNGDDDFDDLYDSYLDPIGVTFLPAQGTQALGFSIWLDEFPTISLVKEGGKSRWIESRHKRAYRFGMEDQPEPQRGLVWHLLRSARKVDSDVVVFDPESSSRASDDDDDH